MSASIDLDESAGNGKSLAAVGLVGPRPPRSLVLAAVRRLTLRMVLHRYRRHGTCMHEALALGTENAVAEFIVSTGGLAASPPLP